MSEPFPFAPKSKIASLSLWLYCLIFIILSQTEEGGLNIFVFYWVMISAVIFWIGSVGFENITDKLGLDVNKQYWRYPVYIAIGLLSGHLLFLLAKSKLMHLAIYPLPLSFKLSFSLIDTAVVVKALAVFVNSFSEEVLKMGFGIINANWIARDFKKSKNESILLGFLLATLQWALLHIGWGVNLMSYIFTVIIGMFWFIIGMIFYFIKKSPLHFGEIVIITPIFAHWIWNMNALSFQSAGESIFASVIMSLWGW
ncbi:MAG: hypothetical protein J7K62_03230 [Thermoplasmata archaeon]|nr:hypothetical protein [Thermoplasmata archaeon]